MKIFIFVCCTFFSLLMSCQKCDEPINVSYGGLIISPYNTATNKYFYSFNGVDSLYKRDSLSVLTEKGDTLDTHFISTDHPAEPSNPFYSISIGTLESEDYHAAFSREINKKIFIHYSRTKRDTLDLAFKAKQGRCQSSEYDYLRVYKKGILLVEMRNDLYANLTLNY